MNQTDSSMISFKGPAHDVKAYLTKPVTGGPYPGLILVHEIWGLLPHIKSVSDRYAAEGFVVLAPDLMGSDPELAPHFSEANIAAILQFMGTLPPGRMRDPASVQEAMAKLPDDQKATVGWFFTHVMGGKLPQARFTQELSAALEHVKKEPNVNGDKIGSLGFCFGGTQSFRLACTGATQACVVFYGHNPDPIELVEKINCPIQGNYGAEDAGLNATLDQLVAAMVRYKKDFEMKIYPGAPHAFFNDTNPYMYREAAAKEAWTRSLGFLKRTLA
jgi:carboxymethylenebutenolidase